MPPTDIVEMMCLLMIAEDGVIDQLEDAEFDELLGMAEKAAKCYYEMRFAKRRKESET